MSFFEIFIRRPVFSTVLSLLIVLVGLVSFTRLTVREYPKIDEPIVSVQTFYPGASAEIIETQVTQILESSIAGIEGIEVLTSTSKPERSQINVTFNVNRDPDVAASDVRDRVSRVRGRLPDETEEPVISKVEADAQPIMYLAFTSDTIDPLDMTDLVDRFVKDRLQNVPGVADVRIFGERRYAMRIWVDRARLAAYDLTVQDVEDALRRQNIEIPAGRVESVDREFTVLSKTDLQTPAEFESIIVKRVDGFPVKLGDVAHAEIGPDDERRIARFTGKQSVSVGIVKQATANPLDVAEGVKTELPRISDDLPADMEGNVGFDSSIFIDRSIDAVFQTIAEAIILVALVIFFFLRTPRVTLIPIVTIPVALIGAFALLYAFGFSINTLTLLAMVLAIGLVVDDAIVVVENIHRHVEEGNPPFKAAIQGINEIAFAVIAMSTTLVAVYAPVAFAPGRIGKLFTEFALALAGAVIVSGFVALTLTPMMSSKLLHVGERHGRIYNTLERAFAGLIHGYRRLLALALTHRAIVVAVAVVVAAASYLLFTNLKSELAPIEDRGTVIVAVVAPEGATVEYTARYMREIEPLIANIPEVVTYFLVAGFPDVTSGVSFTRLKEWEERDRSQQTLVAELQPKLFRIPGVLAFAINPASLGSSFRSKPVEYVVQTTQSYETLEGYMETLLAEAQKFEGFVNVESDLKLNKPQLEVEVDRDKVSDVGVEVSTIGRTLETMLGGRQVTRFNMHGEQYDVIVQVADVDRQTPEELESIYVRGADGGMIQLSNLIDVRETVAPKELNRFNQLRSATLSANLLPGYTIGDGLEYLEDAAERVLPASLQFDYSGQSREFKESSTSLYFVFVLSLFFIYLVLSAQFESFVDPLIIMLTVPLSMTGALLALYLTGGTLNVYSQIGLITLVGLITKHGILIVEFANQLQRRGMAMAEATVEAAVLRLRPILMTTGAMVLGAMPLAIATGAGAESRQQIGWVIVGGVLVGTMLTLFVVPAVYTLVARQHHAIGDEEAEPAGAGKTGATKQPAE